MGSLMLLIRFAVLVALCTAAPSLSPNKPPLCQLVFGIRISSAGNVEKVLDAARCQNADEKFIRSFLGQLAPQLTSPLLELEISDCALDSLDGPETLGRIALRRLSIQRSGLQRIATHTFAGQENVLEELDLSDNRLEEVPHAIRNLTALARLDLSRNTIRSLPPGSVFFHLLKLRHLNLSHNRLGYLDQVLKQGDAKSAGQPLPMSVFNLEPLREHIETIYLRSNNLTAFPEQFSRSFARLRHLDLSNNNFKNMPAQSFAQMPQLRRLLLDNNHLTEVPKVNLPITMETLSLRGNPIICDCNATWLWEWIRSREGVELNVEDCRQPSRWSGIPLAKLPQDFCQVVAPRELIYYDSDVYEAATDASFDSLGDLIFFDMQALADSIQISFNVMLNISADLRWAITYRQFGSIITDGPIMGMLNENATHSITGLLPSTGYQVCAQIFLSGGAAEQKKCQEILTEPSEVPPFPVNEVAVAASVSTSTTLVVVVLVCCCCPGMKRNKKGLRKSFGDSSPEGSSGSDDVDCRGSRKKKSSVSSSTTRLDWDSVNRWPASDQPSPPTNTSFATFQSGGSTKRSGSAPPAGITHETSNEDESRHVFQATCNYVQQRALEPTNAQREAGQVDRPCIKLFHQHRRPSVTQQSLFLSTVGDGELNNNCTHVAPAKRTRPSVAQYFNASYGLAEFHPGQPDRAFVSNPYMYCTWRPKSKKHDPPLLSSWTSYPDFLANCESPYPSIAVQQPTSLPLTPMSLSPMPARPLAVPVYSLTTSGRPKRKRGRFYWSAAPAPIHTVELQF